MLIVAICVAGAAALGAALGATFANVRNHHPFELPHPSVPYELDVAREPWRKSYPQAIAVPVAALLAIADPAELARARRAPDRLDGLLASYRQCGPMVPLDLVFDSRGAVCIGNGHHRLCIAAAAGYPRLPVVFTETLRIRGWSRPMRDFLVAVLEPERAVG